MTRAVSTLSIAVALAVGGTGPAVGASIEETLSALSGRASDAIEFLSEVVEEAGVSVAVELGFEEGCEVVGDAPFVRDACVALVGRERIETDVEGLIDELLVRPDLDAISSRLETLPDADEPTRRVDELGKLHDVLSEDVDFLFDTLDQLDAIIGDREFALVNVRALDSSSARDLIPDSVKSGLEALPLEDMERDLVIWQAVREEVASMLSELEDLRLLIDQERIEAGGPPREEVVHSPSSDDFPPDWLDGNNAAAVDFRFGPPSDLGEASFVFKRPASTYEEDCWTVEERLHICFQRPHGWVSVYQDFTKGYLWYDLRYGRTCELHVPGEARDGFTSGVYWKASADDSAGRDSDRDCEGHPEADQLTTFTMLGIEWVAPVADVVAPPSD